MLLRTHIIVRYQKIRITASRLSSGSIRRLALVDRVIVSDRCSIGVSRGNRQGHFQQTNNLAGAGRLAGIVRNYGLHILGPGGANCSAQQ